MAVLVTLFLLLSAAPSPVPVAAASPAARRAAAKSRAAVPDTLKGEVVDLECYMRDGRQRGPDHEACARECIVNGQPVGILAADGTVHLAIGRDMKRVNELLAPYAARRVRVTGKKLKRARMSAFLVEKVEELPPEKPKAKSKSRSL